MVEQAIQEIIKELYNNNDGNDDILSDIGDTDNEVRSMWSIIPYGVSDGPNVINIVEDETLELIDEGIVKEYGDRMANFVTKYLGLGSPKYLGGGFNGKAYTVDDKVLKITSDLSEANENLKLIGKPLNYIAQPYHVYVLTPKSGSTTQRAWVILLEKLKLNDNYFQRMFNRLETITELLFSHDRYNILETYYYYRQTYNNAYKDDIEIYLNKNPEDSKFYHGILNIIDELISYGIESLDYMNYRNLGFKPSGNIGYFDVGAGNDDESIENKPEPIPVDEDALAFTTTDNEVGTSGYPEYAQGYYGGDTDTEDIDLHYVNERELSSMPNSQSVEVKQKCRLGGNGNTSTACNTGDINNLSLKSIVESVLIENSFKEHIGWLLPDDKFIPIRSHIIYLRQRYKDVLDKNNENPDNDEVPEEDLYRMAYDEGLIRIWMEFYDSGPELGIRGKDINRIKDVVETYYEFFANRQSRVYVDIFGDTRNSYKFVLPQDKEEFANFIFGSGSNNNGIINEDYTNDLKRMFGEDYLGWILPNNEFIKLPNHYEYLRKMYPDHDKNFDFSGEQTEDDEFQQLYHKAFKDGLIRIDYQYIDNRPNLSIQGYNKERIKSIVETVYYPQLSKIESSIHIDVNGNNETYNLPQDREDLNELLFGNGRSRNGRTLEENNIGIQENNDTFANSNGFAIHDANDFDLKDFEIYSINSLPIPEQIKRIVDNYIDNWAKENKSSENLNENIKEKESKYKNTKASLQASKSISKEMKELIAKYLTSGSNYKMGGRVFGLIKPKGFTEKTPKSSGVSLGADKKGFFCYTHRARCHSYPTPEDIPIKEINFIESTG